MSNKNKVPRKFRVVKRVLLKDKNKDKIGTLEVGTTLLVVDLSRTRRKSVISAEIMTAEVIQANEKKVHGFCFTHDFRGNVLIQEIGGSEEKSDSKEQEISPSAVLKRIRVLVENINHKQMRALIEGLEERHYKQGESIMKEGAEGFELFIFQQGRGQISQGNTKPGVLIPGDYFGEEAINNLENSCEWVYSVTAITDVVCLVASQKMVSSVLGLKDGQHFVKEEERVAFATVRSRKLTVDEGIRPSGKQIEFIKDAVKETTLFSRLNDQESHAVISKMRLRKVKTGQIIINQNDKDGVRFYVISKGAFKIIVDGEPLYDYERGYTFGERALIQNAPRAATVQSLQPSEVWVLHRDDYRVTVAAEAKKKRDRLLDFIKSIRTFKDLSVKDRETLADSFEEKKYKENETVIKQGEQGDRFYVIMNGIAKMTKKNQQGKIIDQADLTVGKYFGELALTSGKERAATITAHAGLTCLELSKDDFENLMKPLAKVFKKREQTYLQITKTTYRRISAIECGVNEEEVKQEEELMLKVNTPLEKLTYIGLLGKGAFGLVTLVEDPVTENKYALKAIRKHDIVEHGQVEHIVNEKNIQNSLKTPFCVKLYRTYRDDFRVYFLLEACTGGDIFTVLRKRRTFNERATRFYSACIIAAFDHMHSRNIIYRDLKPENLVMDHTGYAKLTDFGFAKIVIDKTRTVCGTPDYLAPEVIIGRGHGKGVDYWTLGIFIYECINGVAPFYSKKDMDCYTKILRAPVTYTKRMSIESKQLVQKLLKKRAAKRLGVRKGDDVHQQPFFNKWNWEKFLKLEIKAPYPPKKLALKDPNIPRYRAFDKDIACPFQEFEKLF